jgi:hypothetical protein
MPINVWLGELAALSDPNLVPRTVAAAVDVQEQPDRRLRDTLVNALRSRRLLLILDNCEHLIDACARLVDARYWWFFGHQREGRQRLDRILEPLGRPALLDRTEPRRIQASTWAFALHAAGVLDLMADDFVRAREHLSDAIGLWRKLGDKRATAESLH